VVQILKPSISDAELARIKEVLDSAWLGQGSAVIDFEERVKQCIGARRVISVNSGTSALHLALDALGIGEGHEVLISLP
jgi:perosamine synthetase